MMTCTSEISGNASSGMRRSDQIPASTRSSVPVKPRNRFRAHQSIDRAITLHPSRGVDAQLLAGDGLAVLLSDDGDLPSAAAVELARCFIKSIPFVAQGDRSTHCSHAHRRHGGHEECDGDFPTGNRSATCFTKLHSNGVAAFAWRSMVGPELDACPSRVHRTSGTPAGTA